MLDDILLFYNGYWLDEPVGNNAFSYDGRSQKRIWVAPMERGTPEHLAVGEHPAFAELEDGKEHICRGLAHFLYFNWHETPVLIFDNHNHAFFFWLSALRAGTIPCGGTLVHIDQHTDMRQPRTWPAWRCGTPVDLESAFRYANRVLNVGNFIQPALRCGLFARVEMINSIGSLGLPPVAGAVVDLDIDLFAPEMGYLDDGVRMESVRAHLRAAGLITIATSPYFMDSRAAIEVVRKIFSGL